MVRLPLSSAQRTYLISGLPAPQNFSISRGCGKIVFGALRIVVTAIELQMIQMHLLNEFFDSDKNAFLALSLTDKNDRCDLDQLSL